MIARPLTALVSKQGLTKTELARRIDTGPAQLDRLLDPDQPVTLDTLARAAEAVGRNLRMELV